MNYTINTKPRELWTDGWNSFWHFFFGMIAIEYNWIIPIFIVYQLMNYKDKNLFVDLGEFFIGLMIGFLIQQFNVVDNHSLQHIEK